MVCIWILQLNVGGLTFFKLGVNGFQDLILIEFEWVQVGFYLWLEVNYGIQCFNARLGVNCSAESDLPFRVTAWIMPYIYMFSDSVILVFSPYSWATDDYDVIVSAMIVMNVFV